MVAQFEMLSQYLAVLRKAMRMCCVMTNLKIILLNIKVCTDRKIIRIVACRPVARQ
jgi:hypothetical protein